MAATCDDAIADGLARWRDSLLRSVRGGSAFVVPPGVDVPGEIGATVSRELEDTLPRLGIKDRELFVRVAFATLIRKLAEMAPQATPVEHVPTATSTYQVGARDKVNGQMGHWVTIHGHRIFISDEHEPHKLAAYMGQVDPEAFDHYRRVFVHPGMWHSQMVAGTTPEQLNDMYDRLDQQRRAERESPLHPTHRYDTPEDFVYAVNRHIGGAPDIPHVALDSPVPQTTGADGMFDIDWRIVHYGKQVSDGLRKLVQTREKTPETYLALLVTTHELVHGTSPVLRSGQMQMKSHHLWEEGITELKARRHAKQMMWPDGNVPRWVSDPKLGAYHEEVERMQFLETQFGTEFLDRVWNQRSAADRKQLVVDRLGQWFAKRLQETGYGEPEVQSLSARFNAHPMHYFLGYHVDDFAFAQDRDEMDDAMRHAGLLEEQHEGKRVS